MEPQKGSQLFIDANKQNVGELLGVPNDRVLVCLQFTVTTKGAYALADPLIPGYKSVLVESPWHPRWDDGHLDADDENAEQTLPHDALHEIYIIIPDAPTIDLLLSEEGGQGTIVVSLVIPFEVVISSAEAQVKIPAEEGEDRYYVHVYELPANQYLLAVLTSEESATAA